MSWSIELEPKKLYTHTPDAPVMVTNVRSSDRSNSTFYYNFFNSYKDSPAIKCILFNIFS